MKKWTQHMQKFSIALVVLMTSLFIIAPLAAPSKQALNSWKSFDASSQIKIDHASWDQMLKKYLSTQDNVTLFAYKKVTKEDKATIQKYIQQLEKVDPTKLTKKEAMAYWINVYNAVTVDEILKHYPVKSIKEIKTNLIKSGPWGKELFKVQGQKLSLDDIEHKILRPIFQDNRVHYLINCASYSCPNLSVDAITSSNLEAQLTQGAKNYINHKRAVNFQSKDKLVLSSIWNWFKEDFGTDEAKILAHLQKYAEPELKAKLAQFDGSIDYDYNWNLNE